MNSIRLKARILPLDYTAEKPLGSIMHVDQSRLYPDFTVDICATSVEKSSQLTWISGGYAGVPKLIWLSRQGNNLMATLININN